MSTFNPRWGYHWTDAEREIRKTPVRQAQHALAKLQEQVRRISLHAPEFKNRAEQAYRNLEDGLGKVAGLNLNNNGPKYKPLSPEETDAILAKLPELLKPWHDLTRSPDYVAAVQSSNRLIRKQNALVREHNHAVQAQQAALWDQLDAALRKMDEGDVEGSLDIAAKAGIL